jgi:hypothetical protein
MPEIYLVRHERAAGHWVTVALINWNDEDEDKILDLERLGFTAGRDLHGFDFWEEKYFPLKANKLAFKHIPAHGCKLLRFCEVEGDPCLVGDTLHTSQGGEITAGLLSERKLTFATLDLQREASGSLWLWLPHKPRKIFLNDAEIEGVQVEESVYRLHLEFKGVGKVTIDF